MANIAIEYATVPTRFGLKGMTDRLREDFGRAEISAGCAHRVHPILPQSAGRERYEQMAGRGGLARFDQHPYHSYCRGERVGENPPRQGEGEQ
jgi:hypothetical protein